MTTQEIANRIVSQHVSECLRLQRALDSTDNDAVHEFRLACKRLRYAIERFELPARAADAAVLARITDELGSAHDCVLLGRLAKKAVASAVAWRAKQDQSRHMKNGRALWHALLPSLERRVA